MCLSLRRISISPVEFLTLIAIFSSVSVPLSTSLYLSVYALVGSIAKELDFGNAS